MKNNITSPPGKTRIINTMRELLEERNFSTITISEIAGTAGVTDGLIYKYFKDKRELLHHVLKEHYEYFLLQIERDLKGITGALNKLRKIIWSSIDRYANHRVFARIILLEVRNSEKYFKSEAYQLVRKFNRIILDIIKEGVASGEITSVVPPSCIRHAIFGAIEHACLNRAIFNEKVSTDETAENITQLIFNGIKM
ncbi:MAG: TetR/AcrR family transcriptional regulator [Deltaproteobacteria bacterium]|nr:TetR/AcrR family transcriptional regulator [Deltaproteobacteria bacterium]